MFSSIKTERFTKYGPEIGAEKGHFISSCKRPLKANLLAQGDGNSAQWLTQESLPTKEAYMGINLEPMTRQNLLDLKIQKKGYCHL